MMDKLIGSFTEQIKEAMEIGSNAILIQPTKAVRNVVVCGLGGSGIGGDLVTNLVHDKMLEPMATCKEYVLPEYVDKHTLLIIVSYSGNTEETLHMLKEGIDRNAKIVCIASGGSLIKLAQKAGLDYITIPAGLPPRACLAYSFIQQLYILNRYSLIDDGFRVGLEEVVELIDDNEKKIRKEAKQIAKKLKGKTPVIYAAPNMAAVALRFRQQLNENAKVLAWHAVIPEMNHNELVGWTAKGKYAVVMLRNESDYERIQHRMEINKTIIEPFAKTIIELNCKGDSLIAQELYMIHLLDWVSYYLAEYRGVDAMEVKVIDFLKSELAN